MPSTLPSNIILLVSELGLLNSVQLKKSSIATSAVLLIYPILHSCQFPFILSIDTISDDNIDVPTSSLIAVGIALPQNH